MPTFSLIHNCRNIFKPRLSRLARRLKPLSKRRLQIEPLEQRALLAGDTGWLIPIGDSERVRAIRVHVDDAGDAYVTGLFDGVVDFDPQNTHSGDVDILVGEPPIQRFPNDRFIAKYSASGDFLWVKGWEGHYGSGGLATDPNGGVYTVGGFSGSIQLASGVTLTSAGGADTFVAKLNAADGAVQWASSFSGPEGVGSEDITVDDTGIYLSGRFNGAVDFDPGPGEHILTSAGRPDAHVVKLNFSGALAWAIQFGGGGNDSASDVDVDRSGNVYVTGGFGYVPGEEATTADFGPHTLTSRGGRDIFIAKLNTAGTVLWAQRAGSSQNTLNEGGRNIAVNDADPDESNWRVYVNGVVSGTVADFGDEELVGFGGAGVHMDNVFVTQLSTDGDFLWARQLGGNRQDGVNGITVDPAGNVYTAGTFRSTADFDPSPTGERLFTATRKIIGGEVEFPDPFVSKLDANGAYVAAWHIQRPLIRGGGFDGGFSIALDNDDSLYLASGFAPTEVLPYGVHSVYESVHQGYTALMKFNPSQSALAGSVFFDLDENGKRNLEPGLAGLIVFLDVDGDGRLDVDEPSTTTNREGQYFLQAEPGLYQVALISPCWTRTLSPPAQVVDGADSSLFVDGIDFGVFHPHQTVEQLSSDTPLSPPPEDKVTSTVSVDETFQIADLDIEVNLTKASAGTVDLKLIGPDGTAVMLFDNPNPTLTETIFDNEAALFFHEGAEPFMGRFRPSMVTDDHRDLISADDSLSEFYGKNVQGDWKLEVLWDAPSAGGADPPVLENWKLTALGYPTLDVQIDAALLPENAGPGAATATVRRNGGNLAAPLVVNLQSSDESELTAPQTVVIPANERSVTFPVSIVDDTLLDGEQRVWLSATACNLGYLPGVVDTIVITDHEFLSLELDRDTIPENGGPNAALATLTRSNTDVDQPLTVILTNSDNSEISIPATVQIPANQQSTTFFVGAVDDQLKDGTQTATITATSSPTHGYIPGAAVINITDHEDPEILELRVSQDQIFESAGPEAVLATITRSDPNTSSPLVVNLSSSDTTEATAPATVVIPANQASSTFFISVVDDDLMDFSQHVRITATAVGHADVEQPIIVHDHETLFVDIAADSVAENVGPGATTATVTRSNIDNTDALTVTIFIDDQSEAAAPATVTIPANQASVAFTIDALDDDLLDGVQSVVIGAQHEDYFSIGDVVQVADHETLTVVIDADSLPAAGGLATTTARVTRGNTDIGQRIWVQLVSSDTTKAAVPTAVTIRPNQSSATFVITSVDDGLEFGTQNVTITASADGYLHGMDTLTVTDDGALVISISDPSIAENAGATTATVTRVAADLGQALTVTLSSSDASEAATPASVTIPAGEESAEFSIAAVDDNLLDGVQTVQIAAAFAGMFSAPATLEVTDYETLTLTIDPGAITESDGAGAGQATVTRSNQDIADPLIVTLTGSDPSEAGVQATLVIPAGESSAVVLIDAVNDMLLDGPQTVQLDASSAGYVGAQASLEVLDNDRFGHNVDDPFDVNADGLFDNRDVIDGVNLILDTGGGALDNLNGVDLTNPLMYPDVDDNGFVVYLDALRLISHMRHLNAPLSAPSEQLVGREHFPVTNHAAGESDHPTADISTPILTTAEDRPAPQIPKRQREKPVLIPAAVDRVLAAEIPIEGDDDRSSIPQSSGRRLRINNTPSEKIEDPLPDMEDLLHDIVKE